MSSNPKLYRNISKEPFYANGRMVLTGETTTLPEGTEPGDNLEEVKDGKANPPKETSAEGTLSGKLASATKSDKESAKRRGAE
ncbi:MAG TPA: hypothetical protein VFZ38_10775 [Vicinamibacterales bacterium]